MHSAARRTLSCQGLGTGPGFLETHSLFSSPCLVLGIFHQGCFRQEVNFQMNTGFRNLSRALPGSN